MAKQQALLAACESGDTLAVRTLVDAPTQPPDVNCRYV
jgi:hypothetical protein